MSDAPGVTPAAGSSLDAIRVRLDLAYDGTDFSGWAVQPGRRTVQGEVQSALATILRTEVGLTVAGRTDAGVHATAQVAHFDVSPTVFGELAPGLLRRLAGLLAPDVRVQSVTAASPYFDARFSALWRRYRYRITDGPTGADPLRRFDTLAWPRVLDVDAMAEAAEQLLGLHDFAAFCRRREGATTIRKLHAFSVVRDGDLITFELRADAFCHSMVRSLVGSLIAVGEGRCSPSWPAGMLGRTSRADDVSVAAPHGLTLVEVRYPDDEAGLAARARESRSRRELG